MSPQDLFARYNVPAPRYTSYPTVPYWDEKGFSVDGYLKRFQQETAVNAPVSLYIHLPYCESLCTFCGCNKRITRNHSVEEPYIITLLKEWKLYVELLGFKPLISEIHFGGGTPTFFSPKMLNKLIEGIFAEAERAEEFEFGFEGHPNNTTEEHLALLASLGFKRVSYGIQDANERIQVAINRIQPWSRVERVVEWSLKHGYESINFDLVYGLPFQTPEDIECTVNQTLTLKPGRIAFYSYAHVPWIKGLGQRKFTDADVPRDAEKRHLYEIGRAMFEKAGYTEIGMDHFATHSDALSVAMREKRLHRNFMGYTTQRTNVMIGLGVSAISDTGTSFAQNTKTVEEYISQVELGQFPVFRGHLLSDEDLKVRAAILSLMCFGEVEVTADLNDGIFERLQPMIDDALVDINGNRVSITEKGKPFLRNACMAFDARLWRSQPDSQMFSMSV